MGYCSLNRRPNSSSLKFNNVGSESCSISIRIGLVDYAIFTIVVSSFMSFE